MTLSKTILTIFLIAFIIFLERLFPFAIFANRKPGKLIHFFEKYIPPVVMLFLLIYSLRNTNFESLHHWLPQFTAILFTITSYIWKKNTLISIFGGTIIYMILIRIL